MHQRDCRIVLITADQGLSRLAVKTITNFSGRGCFLASSIEQLASYPAQRTLFGGSFIAGLR
jgi:hypothetical protein